MPHSTTITEESKPAIREVQELGGSQTILVVDDESVVRTLASGLLRRSGYRVGTADCGQAALEHVAANSDNVDVVLLDVTMPGMSGKEILVKLSEEYPDVAVVICSGYLLSPDDLENETGARPAATVQKPYELRGLLTTLRSVLGESPALSA
ncbi:MAG: response regulator [Verrucomicrobiota bacterium]